MNCELKTILDSSSLYRNNTLIKRATASFIVEKCVNVNLSINTRAICCMGRQLTRVCFNVKNNGNMVLNNAILRASIIPCCCGYVRNCYLHKDYCLNNIWSNLSDCVCFNLPFNRCCKYWVA